MLEKPKVSLERGSITIKVNIEISGREAEKYPEAFSYVWMVI